MNAGIAHAWPAETYELLDFGGSRKLERFGSVVLDRPAPAAEGVARQLGSARWSAADARFERTEADKGHWEVRNVELERWQLKLPGLHQVQVELKLCEFGHVGLFPEQAENWSWIQHQALKREGVAALQVLNLFAYTGGSTLATASAAAAVAHIDAAQSTVNWARQNAELSGLTQAPIRWIAEDALKFCQRELNRGRRYDAVILDPPSYGHGPKGQPWKLDEQLPELLAACGELTQHQPAFMLLTCHSPGYGPRELQSLLTGLLDDPSRYEIQSNRLILSTKDGRQLDCGAMARVNRVRIP